MASRFALLCHPDSPPDRVRGIGARLWWSEDRTRLLITYRVEGTSRLVLPAAASHGRGDGLWEATCFEFFARTPDADDYLEFNFSPSGRWAAYAFDSRRSGMRPHEVQKPPATNWEREGDTLIFRAELNLAELLHRPLRVGISVIIEEEWGKRSYWALAHPDGDPDFHHPDCFALELPAPGFE